MVYISKRTDTVKRQDSLCQTMPRMLLITSSIDEFRKSPQMKLHSKHTTCSLIYCPSKTSSGVFIIKFWFLSRLRRTFIQNHIFRSTSVRCINTSDNVWQLFSLQFSSPLLLLFFLFFIFLLRILSLEGPLISFPTYFLFSVLQWVLQFFHHQKKTKREAIFVYTLSFQNFQEYVNVWTKSNLPHGLPW